MRFVSISQKGTPCDHLTKIVLENREATIDRFLGQCFANLETVYQSENMMVFESADESLMVKVNLKKNRTSVYKFRPLV
jgi:hypothetical protein